MAKEEKKLQNSGLMGILTIGSNESLVIYTKRFQKKMMELMVLIKLFLSQICIIKVM